MRVKVTEEHIQKGKRFQSCECPIALACGGNVGLNVAWVDGKEYRLPEVATWFIRKFDLDFGHAKIEPFEFDMVEIA
jgi:hypothetical protein